jgi:formamidopyrimidine-DNA glycosylase
MSAMPEGHVIHRYARSHRDALGGQHVKASSPQGRFAAGAALIDGRRLESVDAHGKHLFYRWEGGETLHVHLGLFGRFRIHRSNPPPPTDATRLALSTDEVVLYLSGPTVCELIDPETEDTLRTRLGPDPLLSGKHNGVVPAEAFVANLSRRSIPVGAALLDQRVIAGLGNIYRAEALFLEGIDPHLPAREIDPDRARDLWGTSVKLLRRGVRSGRIVSVEPAEIGARRLSELGRTERLYVYKRQGEPCRRCGAAVRRTEMANRMLWWCPSCQPPGASR